MIRRIIVQLLLLIFFVAPAWAGKKEAPPPGPSAQEQQDFTDAFWKAYEQGGAALSQLEHDVNNTPGEKAAEQAKMLNNLKNGKAADGSEAKGFHGDPTDSGPSDWSDWEVQTDKNGNVTGFKEKDFDQMDSDKDGKLSKDEKEAWKKHKEEEAKKNGGKPGHVHKNPDWDKDGDGRPDPGFSLNCFRCYKLPSSSSRTTKIDDGPVTAQNPCEAKGFLSDASCGGRCNAGDSCISVDVDKESGQMIESNATREKDSTMSCYACRHEGQITIEITYLILIIETPYERFVLGPKGETPSFKPSSIMALTKSGPGKQITDVMGNFKQAQSFLGGFNIGMGLGGITSTGTIGMDQLTGLLANNLKSGGSYGSSCFDNVQNEADKQATSAGTPTSKDISEGKATVDNRSNKKEKAFSPEQMKESDSTPSPAINGPVVACGTENGNKALKIYSAGGQLIDTVTQNMLKVNPNILTEKLKIAQNASNMLMAQTKFDFAGYIEKFTGIPIKTAQAYAAQIQEIKAKADEIVAQAAKAKKKSKKKGPELPIVPNDPLYQAKAKEEKKLLGILGGSAPTGMPSVMGNSYIMEPPPKPKKEIPDQYYLRTIGYTPITDPNSAWNVLDPNQKNIVIAVIDSGLDMTHPDGPAYIWTNPKEISDNGIDDDKDGFVDDVHGWNFVNENTDFTDYRGHGTFVTGIIAAKQNNGIGIAGINPGAVIMPLKVTDDKGQTNSFAVYRAINYAVSHGAKIINLSIGGRSVSKMEQEAIARADAMGVLVVIAAGNGGENIMGFGPSSSKNILAVGQIDYEGARSMVSNWGPNLAVMAPGEEIYSLCSKDTKDILPSVRKNGYYQQSGTSFSTPMVTATASLIWAKNPSLTNQQVADIIRLTAKPMASTQWSDMTGFGLLDAAAALRASADQGLIVNFTNAHINRDMSDHLTSIDLYGTVKGDFKEFTLEAGKGKLARSFKQVAGPFTGIYNHQFIARLVIQDVLRGSNEWILRIKVVDQQGKEHIATMNLVLPNK